MNPLEVKGKLISFLVNIESENIFGVQKRTQGKKNRFKAASGWSSKLRNIVWENFKSPCCWIFKSADPKLNGDVKCKGSCKPCGASIIIHVAGECMNVEIRNYDTSKRHPRKNCRLSAQDKAYYANLVRTSSAHSVHTSEANRKMKKGDPLPANLPSETALRVIKCRNGASSTSKFPKDALWSLVELKAVFHPTVIREISIYPFCIRYALPMQKDSTIWLPNEKKVVYQLMPLDSISVQTAFYHRLVVVERKKCLSSCTRLVVIQVVRQCPSINCCRISTR